MRWKVGGCVGRLGGQLRGYLNIYFKGRKETIGIESDGPGDSQVEKGERRKAELQNTS